MDSISHLYIKYKQYNDQAVYISALDGHKRDAKWHILSLVFIYQVNIKHNVNTKAKENWPLHKKRRFGDC